MTTENFVRLLKLQRSEAPAVRSPVITGIGLGADAAEFETVASDPGATARAIIQAAATRDAGGPMTMKPSTIAQAILDAGTKRRGG